MSAWLAQAPTFILAVVLLLVPGLPVALLLRQARGIVRVAVAIAVSLGALGLASFIAPVLGMRWGWMPVLAVAVSVWIVAAALRFSARRKSIPLGGPGNRGVGIGVGITIIGWIVILAYGIGNPATPTQLYDGLFHLNAVEFVLENGDASPLHMTMVLPGQTTSFYPTLWHAFVSLLVPAAGSVVAATNVATIAIIALIWPVALSALTAVAFADRPGAATWAPVLSFGFSVFPLGFLNWGVLYPNLLGTVLVPVLLALVLLAFAPELPWPDRVLRILVALAAAGATALGHPSALLGGVAILVPYLLWRAWRLAREGHAMTRVIAAFAVVAGLVALLVVWIQANVSTHEWLPNQTMAQSFGEVAFLSPVGRNAGFLLGPLAAIGIWRVITLRRWWILGAYAVSILLFVTSAWLPWLAVRSLVVGVWYDDTTRVGALLAIWGLPLAGLGASHVFDWMVGCWKNGHRRRAVAVVVLVALAAASHLQALRNDLRFMHDVSFQYGETSQGLSPDETALFEKIDDELPDDALVIGDPLTGAGLLYAYTGHDVLFPHVTGRYGDDAALLARNLAEGGPLVCDAVNELGVTYAVDFGDVVLFKNHYTTYDGLHDLGSSPILTEVDRVGDAVLYEITGCE